MPTFTPLSTGTILDNRFKLIEDGDTTKSQHRHLLGIGGFGAVYLAHDLSLNCKVAVKQLIRSNEEKHLIVFRREAQLLANLNHPALPKVSRYFSNDDSCFIVMDLIRGDDLEERVDRSGVLPFAEVTAIAFQLFDVLDYLHRNSIVHKDIKPANLKYTAEGQLKLLDFGLAKGSAGLMSQHKDTIVKGLTPAWSPPEQLKGEPTTHQSDLYSAAATIYFLASGIRPPNAFNRAREIAAYQVDILSRLDNLGPGEIPEWFASVIHEAMSLAVDKRPRSAWDMKERVAKAPSVELHLGTDDDNEEIKCFKRGNILSKSENFDEAIQNYDRAIEINPDFAEAYQKRAAAYVNKNNFYLGIYTQDCQPETRMNLDQAIQDSSRAIALKDNFAEAYHTRGRAYFQRRHFKACIKDYENSIELKEDFAEAFSNRAIAFWVLSEVFKPQRQSYLEKSLSDCSKAIELKPQLAQAYATRGIVYSKKGDHHQAIHDCTRGIKLSSSRDSSRFLFDRGLCYLEKGDTEQAILDFSKAIELKPDRVAAYYFRAIAHKKRGEKEKAKHDRRKARQLREIFMQVWIARVSLSIAAGICVGSIVWFIFGLTSWKRGTSAGLGLACLIFLLSGWLPKMRVSVLTPTAIALLAALIIANVLLYIS